MPSTLLREDQTLEESKGDMEESVYLSSIAESTMIEVQPKDIEIEQIHALHEQVMIPEAQASAVLSDKV